MVRRAFSLLVVLAIGITPNCISHLRAQDESAKPSETTRQIDSVQNSESVKQENEPVVQENEPVQPSESVQPIEKPRISSESLLPASTKAWLSVPDIEKLDEQFLKTQFGRLTQDERLKPFIDSLHEQFQAWLQQRNLRLGIKIEKVREIHTGEICLAGILPQQADEEAAKLGRGSHGLVFLVDVSKTEDKARELLANIEKEMLNRGATREPMGDIHGAKINKWKLKRTNQLINHQFAYQTILGGWLLASDNENVFRDIVRRLANVGQIDSAQTLASLPSFQSVMQNVQFSDADSHVKWYIDPFGYVQLAKAIADEEQALKKCSNDWVEVLRKVGFNAIQGIGGAVSFSTGEHEMLHREFVYMPDETTDQNQKRVFGLFDFRNPSKSALHPPPFVPNSASAYFGATWDMAKALKNAGYVVDAFLKDPGAFDKILAGLEQEMDVDVPGVLSKFANQIYIVSESELPIDEKSEHVLIAVKLNGDSEYVFDNIRKAYPDAKEVEIAKFKGLEFDTTVEQCDPDELIFHDPAFGGCIEEEEEEVEPQFKLFEQRYFVVTDEFLFITNNTGYMEKILKGEQDIDMSESNDNQRIAAALSKLSDDKRVSFRQFARIDQSLRTNYEMIRQGKMGSSQTVLARLLNLAFTSPSTNADVPRQQKIDGTKLPENYEEIVAPYFGPMGWVMETTDDGWLVTGCMLKKSELDHLATKTEAAQTSRSTWLQEK